MSAGWQTKRLGELIRLEYGKPLPDTKRKSNGKYPVYGANGEKDRTDEFYHDKPSIIVGRKGSAGEINLTEEKFWPLDVAYFVDFDKQVLELKFLYNLLDTLNLPKLAKGVKPGINRNEVYSIEIKVPPLPEQKRIVAILDEVFEGIATAKTNAEKNLQNAREVFQSYLQGVFANPGEGWEVKKLGDMCERITKGSSPKWQGVKYVDKPGILFVTSENVGEYQILMDQPKYVEEKFNTKDKKSILMKGDVLTNIVGASIGRTAVFNMEALANINQAVCLIRCDPTLLNNFYLTYLLNSPLFKQVLHDNEIDNARANLSLGFFSMLPVPTPPLSMQQEIVVRLDNFHVETKKLETIYQQKLANLEELKKSILQKAFAGEMTESFGTTNIVHFPKRIPGITTTDIHAGILAIAYQLHESNPEYVKTFGHVKAEKIAHMVEAHVGIDLGRNPVKDAAGPNDFPHLQKVEFRAQKAGYFNFKKGNEGRYSFEKYRRFNEIIDKSKEALGEDYNAIVKIIELMLPMNKQQSEIFATAYAAWNNLLIRNENLSDDAIVFEARENWHEEKLKIPPDKFFKAIEWMRKINIVPKGKGKLVEKKATA